MSPASSAPRPRALRPLRPVLERLEERDTPSAMYALSNNNFLLRFDSAKPGVIQKVVHVSGITQDEQIKEIAFRPATGQLYGVAVAEVGQFARGRLYRINPATGAAFGLEEALFTNVLLPNAAYGMSFDPVTGQVRVVNSFGQNFRVDPIKGGLIAGDSNLTFASGGVGSVLAIAHDRPFDRPAATTLFALDAEADDLAMIGGVNGSPSSNDGVVTSVGPLSNDIETVNQPADAGFCTQIDFATGKTIAFAAYSLGGLQGVFSSHLLSVDLATGATTLVGTISGGNMPVLGLAIAPRSQLVTGAGPGAGPHVKVFDSQTGRPGLDFLAFGSGFTGGVRVATGDVNGDGVPDIITGAGPGAGPHVKVFDGRSGAELASFLAFARGFRGGVNVAAGDLNGDGRDDIIVSAGPGAGPHVKVFNGADPSTLLHSFFAFGPGFRGGVNVGAGDVNGDNRDDIIVGVGSGGAPHVKVFNGADPSVVIDSFMAYGLGFVGGVTVAVGDWDGDGQMDVITGTTGASALSHVKVFSGADRSVLDSFLAYGLGFTGGVRVAAGDWDGDGRAEIITAPGSGAAPLVKVFEGGTRAVLDSFFAFPPGFPGGAFVGAG